MADADPRYPALMLTELRKANAQRERVAAALERIAAVVETVALKHAGEGGDLLGRVFASEDEFDWTKAAPPAPAEGTRIEELELPVRAYNCLKRARFELVEQVEVTEDARLLGIPNLGYRTLADIRDTIDLFRRET